jgi:superfamily II DNA or RNA helicase
MSGFAPDLFTPVAVATGFALRGYQAEDPEAVAALWAKGYRMPCVRWATGLGKSVLMAELSRRLSAEGRVLVVVDVGTLATDLVNSIRHHTGQRVGVLAGESKEGYRSRRIVVATIQSLYATVDGRKRYEAEIDPADWAGLLIDECESAVADEFCAFARYMLDGNPKARGAGATATPYRGDKQGLGKVFDWAPDLSADGPLNRSMRWGINEGWLVPVDYGTIRASIDFSTLKITRNKAGESDYSEAAITEKLIDEAPLREIAMGVHDRSAGVPSIIVCPARRPPKGVEDTLPKEQRTAAIPRALVGHLDAYLGEGASEAVWGEMGQRAVDIMERFKRGGFTHLAGIKMFEKGFDCAALVHAFMLRKTKIVRVIEQVLGRLLRPASEVRDALNAAPDAESRRAIIAGSSKPRVTFWDLVGLDRRVDDASIFDVLCGDADPAALRRAKKEAIDGGEPVDPAKAIARASREEAEERAAARERAEREERSKRAAARVDGTVEWEVSRDGVMRSAGAGSRADGARISGGVLDILHRNKVPEAIIAKLSPGEAGKLAGQLIDRHKKGLCTFAQARALERAGYDKAELRTMTKSEASQAFDAAKANGWRRPSLVGAREGYV